MLNHFWKQWSKEYLLELRDAHRQRNISKTSAPVKIGDIVLVHDQDHPRGFLKVAQVDKLITGRDGLIRGAALRLPSKNGQQTTLQRPLQLIYPLEITQSECHPVNGSDESNATRQEHRPEITQMKEIELNHTQDHSDCRPREPEIDLRSGRERCSKIMNMVNHFLNIAVNQGEHVGNSNVTIMHYSSELFTITYLMFM